MTARDELDRQVDAFLQDGPTELPGQSYYAVRDRTETTRQRVVIGPWRMPDMNKLVPFGLGAAALVAVLAIGSQLLGPVAPGGVGAAPTAEPAASPSPPPIGGTVEYQMDGGAATTIVTATADGASVSGTAITTFVGGTHTVGLECATDYGDTWALAGTVEQTTVPGEQAGDWSVVLVKDGSPQQVGIVWSIEKSSGSDCDAFLRNFSGWDPSALNPVESGALVPPPDLAP